MSALDTEESLCAEYKQWCADQKLPWIDAMELAVYHELTHNQRLWLTQFIIRWEETVK